MNQLRLQLVLFIVLLSGVSLARAGNDRWHYSKHSESPSPSAECEQPSESPSPTCPAKPSESPSPTCPAKPSESASPSPSESASPSASPSASSSASPSASASPSPSESASPSSSASASASPSASPSASASPVPSPSATPTKTHPPKPSRSPSPSAQCPSKHCQCDCACCSPSQSPSPSPCGDMKHSESPSPATPSSSPQATLSPSPTSCPPNNTRLGPAASFSVFVVGNTSVSADNSSSGAAGLEMVNGDFESGAAVRGGLRLRSFGINQGISANACTAAAAEQFALIASGGNFDFSNGFVFCGNVLVSSDVQVINQPSFGSGSVKVGDVADLTGIDFEEALRQLLDESEGLCSAVEEGGVTAAEVDSSGGITFTASGSAVETFSVSASDLESATDLRFVGFDQSVEEVVVNVMREIDDSTSSLRLSNFGVDLGSVSARSILWNICGGTDLVVVQSFGLPGALLAPSADVTLQNGQVIGQVVARTLHGSGGGQVVNPPC